MLQLQAASKYQLFKTIKISFFLILHVQCGSVGWEMRGCAHHLLSHSVCGWGTREWLSWVILAQVLSWGCSQGISGRCSHLKAWLGLEYTFPKWPTHGSVGRKPQFLLCGHLHRLLLSVLMTLYLASLRAKGLKGNEQAGSRGVFHDLVFKTVHHDFHFIH